MKLPKPNTEIIKAKYSEQSPFVVPAYIIATRKLATVQNITSITTGKPSTDDAINVHR